jgi:hypothetical protein
MPPVAGGSDEVELLAEDSPTAPTARMTVSPVVRRQWLPMLGIAGVWVAASVVLSQITGRVSDWYVMTDELRYERLAISIARSGSPIPRIHGALVRNLDQLYPALLAPLFRSGTVLSDLHRAHILGAWLMCSACIPAFLLARRVTEKLWIAYVVGVLAICIPWMLYASFLLTEVVGYPAFLWALLAFQTAIGNPCRRNDLLALGAIVVVFLARTELVGVIAVFPVAVVAFELAAPRDVSWRGRTRHVAHACVRDHSVAVAAYAILSVAALVFVLGGGTLASVSAYASQTNLSLLSSGLVRAFLGHISQVAFGMAILPFVVATAWAYTNSLRPRPDRERHAFACLVAVLVPVLAFEIAKWDTSAVGPVTYDRYLFYLVPAVLLAFVCALLDGRRMGWALAVMGGIVCVGFAVQFQASFTWSNLVGPVDADSPISILYRPVVDSARSTRAAQATLIGATILLTVGFVLARALLRDIRRLTVVLVVMVAVVLPLETYAVFHRLLTHDGTANRPLTGTGNGTAQFGWLDGELGADADVTIIPYHVSTDFYVSLRYWRDIEFWNRSVQRDAEYPSSGQYAYTGVWFPKTTLRINRATGAIDTPLSPNVVQAVTDTRFRVAGPVKTQTPEVFLIRTARPWRASWTTTGLYDDGWMKPNTPAKVRIYALPGQRRPLTRILSLQLKAPDGVATRPFAVTTNIDTVRGNATSSATTFVNVIRVCVPPRGYTEAIVRAPGDSQIPGDASEQTTIDTARLGSIDVADISVSDYTAGPCKSHTE